VALKEAYRIDRGSLRPPRETAQGFLRVDGYATRVGILEYPDPEFPGGIRRELRRPGVLFDAGSLASYEGAPITDDHPPEMVTPSNATAYAKGTVLGEARRDGDHVAVSFVITDADTIRKAKDGKRELSTGYRILLDETPGVDPVYGRYDVEQTKIEVNHLAIVSAGRAGPTARIRMDARALSSCATALSEQNSNERTSSVEREPTSHRTDRGNMDPKKQIEELEAKLQTAANALAAEKARADNAEGKLTTAVTRADAAEGKVTVLEEQVKQLRTERRDDNVIAEKDEQIRKEKDRADKAEQALVGFDERVDARVKDRVSLERDAAPVLGSEYRFDGITDRELMLAVLDKRGHVVERDRNDAHIRGAFNVAIASYKACDEALQRIADETKRTEVRNDVHTGALNARQAREQMVARNRGLTPAAK
jgi:hypothetical protein